MRGHIDEQLLGRVTDGGEFQSLRQRKQGRGWHSVPPPATYSCRSLPDSFMLFNGSPKTRMSQKYAGVDTHPTSSSQTVPGYKLIVEKEAIYFHAHGSFSSLLLSIQARCTVVTVE